MKLVECLAAVAAAVSLMSSCAVRIDRQKMLDLINHEKSIRLVGSDVFVEKDTSVAPFTTVNAFCSMFDYELVQDDSFHVSVNVPDNFLPYLEVKSENGCLDIKLDGGRRASIRNAGDMSVVIYAPSVDTVNVAGSCDFECREFRADRPLNFYLAGSTDLELGTVKVPEIGFIVSGSGDVDVDCLEAGSLFLSIAGSADAELSGSVGKAFFSVSGSGSVDAEKLKCASAEASVSGSGSVTYSDADGKVHRKER